MRVFEEWKRIDRGIEPYRTRPAPQEYTTTDNANASTDPRQSTRHLPKTARTDNLAAIMRGSTIILDVPVYPLGKVYLEKAIRLDSPVTDPGRTRRSSDHEKSQSR